MARRPLPSLAFSLMVLMPAPQHGRAISLTQTISNTLSTAGLTGRAVNQTNQLFVTTTAVRLET